MTTQARLSVIGIVVADMAKALAFYRRTGLAIPAEDDAEPHVAVEVAGGVQLMFDTEEVIRSFHPDWTPIQGAGRTGVSFVLPDPAGVDALHAELVAAGDESVLAPFDAFWGQRYAVVADPDGNEVSLFAALPS